MQKNANTANGTKATTPATGNGKQVTTVSTLTPVKDDKPKPTVPGHELSDLPPVEDRVLKIQQLSDLVGKREKLRESLKKLRSIRTSTDNRELRIVIEDDHTEWETYNTEAIKACITSMETTIQSKLDEVEKQIRF